ncbi:hypothetical protein [Kitasatospora sp. NPDC091207]|uniref:hypothetical protein n=1 Tax=Kitasatospora sp. NPDC091207 TaxID=3364083 RepID=UPI00381339A5
MQPRIHQIVVALTTALAAVAVISSAAWFYDHRGPGRPEDSPNATPTPNTTRAVKLWPPPDAATVSRLTKALAEIEPELRSYGTPGLDAQSVCTEISGGSDDASTLQYTMSDFAGDGSFFLSKEQGARIVTAVHEIICPNARA